MKAHSAIKNSLFLGIFLLFASSTIFGQINDTSTYASQEFEHMTLVTRQIDGKISKVYISKSSGYYEEIKREIIKDKKRFDNSPLLKIIDKYCNMGWEIISSNMTHDGSSFYTYYFLKRLKAE